MSGDRLWTAMETIPDLCGVVVEWRRHLSDEYDAVRGLLRTERKLAESYPCPAPVPCGCTHRVIHHGPDDIVGVCRCEPRHCETHALARADVVLLKVDRLALGEAVATALGADPDHADVPHMPMTWYLGTLSPYAGFRFPVYLTVQIEPDDFRHIVDALVARARGPFILAAPTNDLFGIDCEEPLRRVNAHFLPLADEFKLDAHGSIIPRRPPEEILAPFLATVLPASGGNEVSVERASPKDARVFRRQGRTWLVVYAGETRSIQHSKGMDYICHLLRDPDEEVHAITLRAAAAGRRGTPAPGSAGEILDSEALGKIRRQIGEIDEDLAAAEVNHDIGRMARLQSDRQTLLAEVQRATGLGGRKREAASDRERARQSVTQAIRRALEAIKRDHAALWRHLWKSLKTGEVFAYRPDDETPWAT